MMKSPFAKIKLVVFDVGKTLFDKSSQKEVAPETICALNSLRKQGIKIGVCTMRTFNHIEEILPLKFDFFILNNGAYVMCDGKTILDERIDISVKDKDFLTCDSHEALYSTELAYKLAQKYGFISDRMGVLEKPNNIVIRTDSTWRKLCLSLWYKTYSWKDTKIVSLQKKGTSRIKGIRLILNRYGIKENEFLYFGDGPNDLDVFKKFKYTIAMGNCYPKFLKYAYSQTKECKDNGVSQFLKNNLLLNLNCNGNDK